MEWCVYMLLCDDNTIYTGITNDLKKDLKIIFQVKEPNIYVAVNLLK